MSDWVPWHRRIPQAIRGLFQRSRKTHASIAALWGQTEQLSNQVAHLSNQVAHDGRLNERNLARLQANIQFLQRRLARLSDGSAPVPAAATAASDTAVAALHHSFEEQFRGPRAEIKDRFRPHLERLRGLEAVVPGKPLLDIGCGRGEWLELLGEAGISAYGVDLNLHAVDACAKLGLEARHSDALEHLTALPDAALGAITAFHVIEHLPLSLLLRLIEEAARTLRPGGALMLESPNPENLKVGACTFYNDPTHHHPIPPLLGKFLVQSHGFADVELVRLHPYPEEVLIREDTEVARRINEFMYGPQDYALIARRA